MAPLARLAPAKINLTLHVTGRADSGYHLLDSLVVFAGFGDVVSLTDRPGLALTGPMAVDLAAEADNLVLRAARMIGAPDAGVQLDKRLPVASGMGGGSSDAAAVLHLLAQARGLPLPDTDALMRLGADLPVCMAAPAPCRMRGLGERVDRVAGVPSLPLLLVNSGQALPTPLVFKGLLQKENPPMPRTLPRWRDAADLALWLTGQRNDLEAPARALLPQIAQILDQIAAQPGCLLARMTGSGATCFGLFAEDHSAAQAAAALKRPGWFVQATASAPSGNSLSD